MADSTEPDVSSAIESAMSRLAPDTTGNVHGQGRRSIGRRDYDQALAHRLEQLRTAMGEDTPAQNVAIPTGLGAGQASHPVRTFRTSTLALASLLSALAGACLMWLATASDKPMSVPQTKPIGFAPAAVTPPAAPETPAAAPAAPMPTDQDRIRERLESWRQAWSSRDGTAYLSHYSPDFIPADGQSHADWAAARRKNLASRKDIDVGVRELRVERIDDSRMKASFLQDYASGNYREKAQEKTLLFVRYGSDWLIASERQGVVPKPGPPN